MSRQVLFIFGAQACVPADSLSAAKRLGYRTAVMGRSLPCDVSDGLVDRFERVDLTKPETVVDAACALDRNEHIDGVVAYDDHAVPVVARVAAALGLPGHPVAAADAARDKVTMKCRLAAGGVPIAEHALANDEDDAVRWATSAGYPVVVKPVRGSASQGVIRADSEAALRDAYRRVSRIVVEYGLDTGGRPATQQLVESYLDGSEVSVELLVQGGTPHALCVFDKPQPLEGPFFEETIYVTPTRLPLEVCQQVQELAVRAAHAIGLSDGLGHCEIRITPRGPVVLELAARLIGGACSRVFRYAFGEDIHECVIQVALGEPVSIPRPRPTAAGAMMLPIRGTGRLVQIRGLERAREVLAIRDVIVTASPGDPIIPFPEQGCYVGFLTASADTPEMAIAALTAAAAEIELDLAAFGAGPDCGPECCAGD